MRRDNAVQHSAGLIRVRVLHLCVEHPHRAAWNAQPYTLALYSLHAQPQPLLLHRRQARTVLLVDNERAHYSAPSSMLRRVA